MLQLCMNNVREISTANIFYILAGITALNCCALKKNVNNVFNYLLKELMSFADSLQVYVN